MYVKWILNLGHETDFNKIESYKYLGKAGHRRSRCKSGYHVTRAGYYSRLSKTS